MNGRVLSEAQLKNLPVCLRLAYLAWLMGVDMREVITSKATFSRYRTQLLSLRVNIAIRNVVVCPEFSDLPFCGERRS